MISGYQHPAAPPAKAADACAVLTRYAVDRVNREQPQLVEVRGIERAQNRITFDPNPIAGCHRKERRTVLVDLRLKKSTQQGKTPDMPIVRRFGNGRLQQNPDRRMHEPLSLALRVRRCGRYGHVVAALATVIRAAATALTVASAIMAARATVS